MANIAVITLAKTHAAPLNTKTMLENAGHTVTLYNQSEVSNTNLETFDIIVTCRIDSGATNANTHLNTLKTYWDNEKPFLLGFDRVEGTGAFHASKLRLCQQTFQYVNSRHIEIVDNTSPITDTYNVGDLIQFATDTGYFETIDNNYPYVGWRIGKRYFYSPNAIFVQFNKGVNNLDGNPIPTKAVYNGYLYGANNGYTAAARTLTNHCIDWLLAADGEGGGEPSAALRRFVQFF